MRGSRLMEMKLRMIWKLGLSRPYQASGLKALSVSVIVSV